jgi:peptidoglycan/LPS O-acetylase OafA/YrhL
MAQQLKAGPSLPYRPGLDGLRGIAVVGVLFFHLEFPWALGGYLGVESFIVISGYLITSLLLEDYYTNGKLDLGRFWLRRIRRLWPALWLLLIGVLTLGFTIAPQSLNRLREDVPAAVFYFTNWLYILREIPYFERFASPPLLQHLWSLAIEEQFYLFWPLLLWASLRLWKVGRGRFPSKSWLLFPSVFAALSAGWMTYIMVTSGDTARAYYGTDTRAFGFLLGAVLAVLWPLSRPRILSRSGKMAAVIGGGLSAVGLLWLYTSAHEFIPWLYPWGFFATDLFTGLLIAAVISNEQGWGRVLGNPLLRWIGTRSYAIYLWHWPLIALYRPGAECRWPWVVCAFGHLVLTLLMAEWSYQVVENPIRRRGFRNWWREQRAVGWRLVGFPILLLSAVGFVSWRPWTNSPTSPDQPLSISTITQQDFIEITSTSSSSSSTLSGQTPVPEITSSPIYTQSVSSLVASTPTSVFTPTPSPTPRWTCYITLIGDSVMARTYSTWMEKNSIYLQFWVEAQAERQTEDIVSLVQTLRKSGHLYPNVVLHTGTNGMYSASTLNEIIAQMARSGVHKVYLLTVRVPVGWEEMVNEHIVEVAEDWPQLVVLVDWNAISGEHPEWFLDDGVHLTETGAQAYVDLTLDVIQRDGCAP